MSSSAPASRSASPSWQTNCAPPEAPNAKPFSDYARNASSSAGGPAGVFVLELTAQDNSEIYAVRLASHRTTRHAIPHRPRRRSQQRQNDQDLPGTGRPTHPVHHQTCKSRSKSGCPVAGTHWHPGPVGTRQRGRAPQSHQRTHAEAVQDLPSTRPEEETTD
jgi:hypothetical protein